MESEIDHAAHGTACGCGHHHPTSGAISVNAVARGSGWGAALLPALACAVCPACLTTYAKVLSVFGVSFGFDAVVHHRLLVAALGTSLTISAWRSWKRRRVWPLAIAMVGTALVAAGHVLGELHALEWGGMLLLLGGAWAEHYRLRRRALAHA
jgi:hypothetical protein